MSTDYYNLLQCVLMPPFMQTIISNWYTVLAYVNVPWENCLTHICETMNSCDKTTYLVIPHSNLYKSLSKICHYREHQS